MECRRLHVRIHAKFSLAMDLHLILSTLAGGGSLTTLPTAGLTLAFDTSKWRAQCCCPSGTQQHTSPSAGLAFIRFEPLRDDGKPRPHAHARSILPSSAPAPQASIRPTVYSRSYLTHESPYLSSYQFPQDWYGMESRLIIRT